MYAIFRSGTAVLPSDRSRVFNLLRRGRGRKGLWEGVGEQQVSGSSQQLLAVYVQDLGCVAFASPGGVHGCD